MIHFKLKDIDSVIPIGNDLNWFSLTDGELYLNVVIISYLNTLVKLCNILMTKHLPTLTITSLAF